MTFEESIELVLSHEGGYSVDPTDNGNWTGGKQGYGTLLGTKYGIAANSYPTEDIKNLTREKAKEIYRKDYWDKNKCSQLPSGVGYLVFDCGINMGTRTAAKLLQKSVGVTADGIIGNQTIEAAKGCSPELFMVYRLDKYMRIIGGRHANAKYAKGWSNRCLDVLNKVKK